jgi:hypothetical protein
VRGDDAGGLIEFISYSIATLAGPNQYVLTGLNRALYGTNAIDLPAGSQFLAVFGPVFTDVLPAQFVGQTIYFKYQSFNTTQGGLQPLASCDVYAYTPHASSVIPGVFPRAVQADAVMRMEVGAGTNRSDSIIPIEQQRTVVLADARTAIETIARRIGDASLPTESRAQQGRDTAPGLEEQASSRTDAASPAEAPATTRQDAQTPTENR